MTALRPDNEAIFHAARDIPDPDRRRAYVREACGGDETRIAHVEALLAAADAPDSLLDRPAGSNPVATIDQPSTESPGTVIGPYKLLEQIGEGGFGVVFLAEQQQPVRRKVALKVLKPGMDTRQVIARFEAERQALALMDHPNIARVFDGGESADGRPYVVMELVKGIPITDYCDQSHLSPRERLELFVPVCQAVQHAHQKGIIHRDLKPSNVLVTLHDGVPVPKVIDFGIAKALGQQLTDKTLFTNFAQLIGTPLYMSPEQAALSGLDVDTRSDIYSLGVLLYELLTGTTPFDRERFSKVGYDEIRRIIREEEPAKPSTRISTLGQASTTISTQRKSDPKHLRQVLCGELDWIVMKCLEKDRNRRYETANGLARDIERYLHDEPVLACPPSASYRLRKFVRRNKGPVLAAALGLVLVAVLGGGVGWYFRDRSTRQAVVAARVQDALDESGRLYRAGKVPEALNVAQRAASLLDTGPADEALAGRVQERVEDLETVLKFDEALFTHGGKWPAEYERLFRDCGIDLAALPADEAAARISGRFITGDLAAALDLWAMPLDDSANAFKRKLIAVARQADPDPWRDRARQAIERDDTAALEELVRTAPVDELPPATLRTIAWLMGSRYSFGSSDRPSRDFLRRAQRRHPSDVWLNHMLADSLVLAQPLDWEEGAGFYRVLLGLRPNSPTIHRTVGQAMLALGKPDEAMAYFRMGIELDPKAIEPALQAEGHIHLASWLKVGGRAAEAEQEFRRARALIPDTGLALNNFAWGILMRPTLPKDGGFTVALAQRAVELENDGAYWDTLGVAYYRAGRWQDAIDALKAANGLSQGRVAYNTLFIAMAYWQLGQKELARKWYAAAQTFDQRRDWLAEAAALIGVGDAPPGPPAKPDEVARFSSFPWYHPPPTFSPPTKPDEVARCSLVLEADPQAGWALVRRAQAYQRRAQPDQAAADFRQALALYSKAIELKPADWIARFTRGNLHAESGQWEKASTDYASAVKRRPADVRAHYWLALARAGAGDRTGYRSGCAAMLQQFGQTDQPGVAHWVAWASVLAPDAVEDLDRPVQLAESALRSDPKGASYTNTLGAALYRAGRFAEAIRRLQEAHTAWEKTKETRHSPAYTWFFLAMAHHRLGQAEEGRRWLDKAIKGTEQETRNNGLPWSRRLTLQLLRREAEALLKDPAAAEPKHKPE
jgi:serine/threonine protein kinase/tetratricopeptide (TPR) repeat protein